MYESHERMMALICGMLKMVKYSDYPMQTHKGTYVYIKPYENLKKL